MRSIIPAIHAAVFTSFARAISKAKRKATLVLFSVALLLAGGATAGRGQSALDGFDPNANGTVQVVVVQPDGKILIGGDFTTLAPNGGAAVTRNRIARLNPDGTLDTIFDPNADGTVFAIAVQADGKILAAGGFTSIGGQTRNRIARLNADGTLDTVINPNANGTVFAIAVQADGQILAGGNFTTIGGATRNRIARLEATTGAADSFDPNANNTVNAIAVQADGKILAGGNFTSIGGQARNRIARLDPTTGAADSFNPNASSVVDSIAVQADGKILAGGNFSSIGGQTRNRIARLDPTSGLADSLDSNANNLVLSIAVQADGKVLAGGQFNTLAPNGGAVVTRNNIARLETDGRLDQTLDLNVVGNFVPATAVQPDGKILIGGSFSSIFGVARNNIARLNTDGTLDTAFNPTANSTVLSIAVQADGKILVGGFFTSIGGQTRNFIARLEATTGLADSFNPNANEVVNSIAVQADGRILAGGNFTSIGGQTRNRIARLDTTTGLADSFDPNANSNVLSIAVLADGEILAGGQFTSIGGQPRNRIARLDATTGLADSFSPDASISVQSIAVQADGKILAGGEFTSIGGQPRNFFARLNNDTVALQNLSVTQTTVTWTRGGSSPQFSRVTFEDSIDNVNYNFLGNGIPQSGSSNWTLTGLSLPTEQNIYIRAHGYYSSGNLNGSESITESVRNAFLAEPPPAPSTFGNISTRLRVETGDNVLIGGFIITGSAAKKVLLRAIGPSLPLVDLLADPTLELHDGAGALISSNDNWMDAPNKQEIIDSTIAPTNDLESAILMSLDPGLYTAIVRGVNGTTGIGLVEAYDLDLAADSILANISTRGLVQTSDNVMIGGIIILGTDPQDVLLRAIGPSLPVNGALADPTLELHDKDGVIIASNDDWRSDQEAEIIATNLPPTEDAESAILATLTPDAYTAIMRGKDDTTGVALIEAYQLDN